MSRRNLVFLFAVLVIALAAESFHSPGRAQGIATFSDADRSDILRIQAYLNNIKTMTARFLQVSSDGDYSEGKLYLSRPGKMRLEYDPPKSLLIIANGETLTYYDKELEQVSYFGLEDTQAEILLRETISFSTEGLSVTAFERGPGVLRLTVIKENAPLEGNITLIFSDKPLGLKKWAIADAQGITTNVSLLGPRFGAPIDVKLFDFEPPKDDSQNIQ